MVINDIYVTPS